MLNLYVHHELELATRWSSLVKEPQLWSGLDFCAELKPPVAVGSAKAATFLNNSMSLLQVLWPRKM